MQSPCKSLPTPAANALASVAVVALGCGVYIASPFNRKQLGNRYGPPEFSFGGLEFLVSAALLYSVALVVYMLQQQDGKASKSLRFFRVAAAFLRSPRTVIHQGLPPPERVAVLATLLKCFFAPLMVMSLMIFCTSAWINGKALLAAGIPEGGARIVFDRFGYWFLMQAIFFIDVLVFTVGYLVESRRLGNEIRSVDPTLLGWGAAMICYPPFNYVTGMILSSQVSDFPKFEDPTVHFALNLLMLGLMAIYASASVALGLKASNLTHRGIIATGPYAVIRHPAYICKNMAWWIASIPAVSAAFARSTWEGLAAVGSVVGWTMVYALRALTEEDHLRRVDGEYDAYMAKVRYRFIPGVL